MREYLRILFNPDELVCSGSTTYANRVSSLQSVKTSDCFISVNPLHTSRADAHVTAHRNFLIEIDKIPLEEQKKYIDELQIPFSTMTFSGNKSFHFVIALAEGCATKEEYASKALWLHNICDKADPSTKNPSRFTRVPNSINNKTGMPQTLIETRGRVSKRDFVAWLDRYPQLQPRRKFNLVRKYYPPGEHGDLSEYTKQFLTAGAPSGERNNRLYAAACDLALNGYKEDEASYMLCAPLMNTDLEPESCLKTIASAFKRFAR